VIDSDGQILAGHGRHAAARQLGMSEVPTIQVEHLTPAQRRAYILADNKLAELAGWDRDLLRIQIEELDNLEFDLGLTGFSIPEIEAILEPAVAPSDDDVPEPLPGPPVSRPGDLWQLGPHKLYCGSALEVGSYEALMGSERAAVVFTDPPYNVKVKGHVSGNGKARHREFAMASGEMSKEAFTGFLRTTFRHLIAFSEEGSIHFQCIDWRHMGEMLAAGEDLYGALLNLVVWNKVNGGMGSLYRSKHELVFVYKNGKAPHRNNVELGRHGRNRTNVWDLAGQTSFHGNRDKDLAAHPTVKPVALVADALRDVSVRGDLVLDPFCGSGTTILAAERTRRQARAIELDPIYVDVAIARFEGRTGTKARLAATSQSFSEVAAARAAERAANDESGEVSHVA
jgi:DNA modification methylase